MPIENSELTPWPLKESRSAGDYKIFKVRSDLRTSPRTGKEHEFFVIESVDWCNIVALTPDNQLVMVEQYRQGTNLIELELPGGMIDPGEGPLETAARELREETGYAGDAPESGGFVYANPAIMNNKVHTTIIRNAAKQHDTELDAGEDLITRLVPLADIPKLIHNGTIGHSLMVAALFRFQIEENDC
jgi:ADP-ribose pyrophosphatase